MDLRKEITLTEEQFNKCCKEINEPFSCKCEGCDCGTFEIKLDGLGYVTIYRNCYISGNCTSGIFWSISDDIEIIDGSYYESSGYYEINVIGTLNKEQAKQLIKIAKDRTAIDLKHDEYGNEFGSMEMLVKYIKDKMTLPENSDDIPQYIYQDILDKISDFETI